MREKHLKISSYIEIAIWGINGLLYFSQTRTRNPLGHVACSAWAEHAGISQNLNLMYGSEHDR